MYLTKFVSHIYLHFVNAFMAKPFLSMITSK